VRPLETLHRLGEFLGELSFGGYKEIGFDKVLLVEGPTDVTTVQQLFRKYEKDHKIVLLPLAGSSMINGSSTTETQLEELRRISEHISVLIDSERTTSEEPLSADRQAFVELCSRAGIACTVLERRAIENYWTERVVGKVMGTKFRNLTPFERLKDMSPHWAKMDNWRMAREMTRDELKQTDLGGFLDRI